MEYYVTGSILTTHGIKGELKIKILGDFNRFTKNAILYIKHENEYHKVIVNSVKEMPPYFLVSFKDLLDINLVEKYRGCLVYISDEDLTDLEEDEFYYHELIGLKVFNTKNEEKGLVSGIREVPQGHLLEISVLDHIKLVPFRKEFIKEVNKEYLIIEEIEGLL